MYKQECKFETNYNISTTVNSISLIDWLPSGNGFIFVENKYNLRIIEKNYDQTFKIQSLILCICLFDVILIF